MTYTYTYNDAAGAGVDIYIIDTGVFLEHSEFEGRASDGFTARGLEPGDNFGHGTHIAGIAAGRVLGVAKNANIISVKILNGDELAINANTISGINYVAGNVRSTQRPGIACMALSGDRFESINDATTILVADRVTVVVAAGNNNEDAANTSPASAPAVIVVGSSDITNTRAPTSNFGTVLDLFAPGVEIRSASPPGPYDTGTGSGTSQATAHVAGIAATLLSANPNLTPGPMFERILELVTPNAISGVPAGTTTDFVYNGGAQ
jgi:cerevisin